MFICFYPDIALLLCCFSIDDDGDTMNLALLQYLFTKGEHDVKPAPHGNAKGGESYVRTMPSTLMKLKTAAIDKTAKQALSFVSNDEGGIEHAVSAGVLPHGRQQVRHPTKVWLSIRS